MTVKVGGAHARRSGGGGREVVSIGGRGGRGVRRRRRDVDQVGGRLRGGGSGGGSRGSGRGRELVRRMMRRLGLLRQSDRGKGQGDLRQKKEQSGDNLCQKTKTISLINRSGTKKHLQQVLEC